MQRLEAALGERPPHAAALAAHDPELFAAFLEMASVPVRKNHLDAKIRALVMVAINASTTHLHEPGLRRHLRQALDAGASRDEILAVYELVAVLGMHTILVGVPALVDELAERGDGELPPLSDEQRAHRERFTRERGYWADNWEPFLALDPELFAAYLEFSTVPVRKAVLSQQVRELIYIAIDAATSHLYESGLRVHLRNALDCGVSRDEILAVYELVALQGMDAVELGVPALLAELERNGSG